MGVTAEVAVGGAIRETIGVTIGVTVGMTVGETVVEVIVNNYNNYVVRKKKKSKHVPRTED